MFGYCIKLVGWVFGANENWRWAESIQKSVLFEKFFLPPTPKWEFFRCLFSFVLVFGGFLAERWATARGLPLQTEMVFIVCGCF
jgi:hypothetical protein